MMNSIGSPSDGGIIKEEGSAIKKWMEMWILKEALAENTNR